MTIALGILASDGVVIAADTQESYGAGWAKYSERKILSKRKADGERSFAATGGGHSDYLDALHQDFADIFISGAASFEKGFQDRLRAFYADYVLPFSVEERPDMGSLIGVSHRTHPPQLWATRLNRLRRVRYYAADGVGRYHASALLSRLSGAGLPVLTAAKLAALVIFHVKEYVDGCGKGTHVTVLTKGDTRYIPEPTMVELEDQFRKYQEFDAAIVERIVGATNEDVKKLVAKVQGAVGKPLVLAALEQTKGDAVF